LTGAGDARVDARVDATRFRVVVTVGTDHHPFDRLVEWTDEWAAAHPDIPVLLQKGTSTRPVRSRSVRAVEMMGYDELVDAMAAADAVVAQGGPGGILDARSRGHRPIVVARRHHLGEHVDDHQLTFTRWMAEHGRIDLADSHQTFVDLLDAAMARPSTQRIPVDEADATEAVDRFRAVVAPLLATGGRRSFLRRRTAERSVAR
jgi:UDP-N-acetylglucosamine transferase subunit ALG13